jgi:hypothetical protein
MHRFITSVCRFALLVFIWSACKDKEEVYPHNAVTYKGTEHELSNGLLIDYGKFLPNEGNYYELFLSSTGVRIHEVDGTIDSLSGTGTAIFFQLFSNSENELKEGEYTFDYSYGPYKASTFFYSYAVFDEIFSEPRFEKIYEAVEGKVSIKRKDKEYLITFDCEEKGGEHITGFFKGPLKLYDEK